MKAFDFVPEWSKSPDRATTLGFFPASPAGTVREATFSETISGILGADPDYSLRSFRSAFLTDTAFEDPDTAFETWDAFSSTYVTTGEKGTRGGSENEYLLPFHHSVIRRIQVDESRNWYRWYWLLMTKESGEYATELHEDFVLLIVNEAPSNVVEELAIRAAKRLDDIGSQANQDRSSREPEAIIPLLPSLGETFRKDLRTWLDMRNEESLSRWMAELRDIVCYHYMTYIIQVSLSLQSEYATIEQAIPIDDGEKVDFEHTVTPIYYGMASEQASGNRPFANEWGKKNIERAIYDSWGRLVVQRVILEETADTSTATPEGAFTLADAINEFDSEAKKRIIRSLIAEFPASQQDKVPDDISLPEMAVRFAETVRRYYTNMGRSASSQTAHTLGYNAVEQLGQGIDREFIEARQRVGKVSRLDRPGTRLFARIFEKQSPDGHIDSLWRYLRDRGIRLDHQSKREMIRQLESMEMIEKRSDGEEAIYVQTI